MHLVHSDQRGFAHLEAGLISIVIAVIAIGGWAVYHHNHQTLSTTTSAAHQSVQGNSSPIPVSPASGDDNASLQNDLNNTNASLNQGTKDMNSTNNALNDSQQEITVPTN